METNDQQDRNHNDGDSKSSDSVHMPKKKRWFNGNKVFWMLVGVALFLTVYFCPALPLEEVFDPAGAGDTFAGGFIGYLASTDDISFDNMKRAVIYGSAMASFCGLLTSKHVKFS